MSVIRTKQELVKYRDENMLSQSLREKHRLESLREDIRNWETPIDEYSPGHAIPNWTNDEYHACKAFMIKLDEIMNYLASVDSEGTYCTTFEDNMSDDEKNMYHYLTASFNCLGYDASLTENYEKTEQYVIDCLCDKSVYAGPNHMHIENIKYYTFLIT